MKNELKIAIIGLGYVGLPLTLEFAKYFYVIGFDINKRRVNQLKKKEDINNEVVNTKYLKNKNIVFTYNKKDLIDVNYYIITVPTPVDKNNNPDLSLLKEAAITVGSVISKNSIVVLESTVYPGVTQNFVGKIIEHESNLKYLKDFNLAYSPERINPGDTKHKLVNIKKVVAADCNKVLKKVTSLYSKIIKAGIHQASSIKVAEMSKAIENAQRDINIAFINEVAMISKELGINSSEVLKAAKTKWNFLDFKPGLVGGHCIGVDPYYLAKAATYVGYDPEIILAGRKINDQMPLYIFKKIKKHLNKKSKILMLGLTFKENVKDIRNSKSAELYKLFNKNKFLIDLHDPIAERKDAIKEFDIKIVKPVNKYDCIIITVAHQQFKRLSVDKIVKLFKKPGLLVDIKNTWSQKKLPEYIKKWSL